MSTPAGNQARVPDDSLCGKCLKKLSLLAQAQRCRCGLVFCDAHRPVERHDCQFDYRHHEQTRLRDANPRVTKAATKVTTDEEWRKEYFRHHPPRSAYAAGHTLGFLVVLYCLTYRWFVCALLFNEGGSSTSPGGGSEGLFAHLLPDPSQWGPTAQPGAGAARDSSYNGEDATGASSRVNEKLVNLYDPGTYADLFDEDTPTASTTMKTRAASTQSGYLAGGPIVAFFRELLCGFFFGYLLAHVAPHLYEKHVLGRLIPAQPLCGGQCRYCIFSWDLISGPRRAFLAEYEMVKDHLLFHIITQGRSNCLSYLYTQNDRSTATIYATVKNKLSELYYGGSINNK
ncbi:unnamed protein product [Amoebophrya sp. A25]|nr:unnamed protein product [Amoebophrya sp. A25]|eukprot:GSA25T00000160001.1